MGISMKVMAASDDEIRAAVANPALVQRYFDKNDGCKLWDAWEKVAYLADLESAFRNGEETIKPPGEEAHAIYSGSAKRFSEALQQITEQGFRERFDPDRMRAARIHVSEVSEILEYWSYFEKLRQLVQRATSAKKGLIFLRYEDY